MALPAKTLSFGPQGRVWGLNIQRRISRKNEIIRWSHPSRNHGFFALRKAGCLKGISGLEQGLGLDFIPYLACKAGRDDSANDNWLESKTGFDLFYKITPAITSALTVNTDFAETEVDDRQINLTRFPLFFPEKRDFFLQDAGIFSFGGINQSPLPYFSRRIGLDPEGNPVDILAGGKITGRTERVHFALLDVQTGGSGELDSKNLAAGRVSLNVLEESSVGLIATRGNPSGEDSNRLGGADFHFRKSGFTKRNFQAAGYGYLMRTETEGLSGGENAWGTEWNIWNDRWELWGEIERIEQNFHPAMGFVKIPGARNYNTFGSFRHRPENSRVEYCLFKASAGIVAGLGNETLSSEAKFPNIQVSFTSGDSCGAGLLHRRENLFEPFEISEGAVIPAGGYRFDRVFLSVTTAGRRPLSGGAYLEFGEFYGGSRSHYHGNLSWQPSAHFSCAAGCARNDVRLPSGDFTASLTYVSVDLTFSPALSWNTKVQHDNLSRSASINSRIKWIIRPGRDLYVVYNQLCDTGGAWRSTGAEAGLKLSWTFRF